MSFRRAVISGGVLFALSLLPPTVEGGNQCVEHCNRQYQATLRYCAEGLAKNPGRKDWYNDCKKNARKFRQQCLRQCKL